MHFVVSLNTLQCSQDAEQAVDDFNGKDFMGER
jgi:hypothetical protein